MPDLRRSRVEASALVPGHGGKRIGPGQLVDLDELVGRGQRVRDLFPDHWFEAPAPTPVRRRRAAPDDQPDSPADPPAVAGAEE